MLNSCQIKNKFTGAHSSFQSDAQCSDTVLAEHLIFIYSLLIRGYNIASRYSALHQQGTLNCLQFKGHSWAE